MQVSPLPKRVPVILTFALIGTIKFALKMPTVRLATAVAKGTRVVYQARVCATRVLVKQASVLLIATQMWVSASPAPIAVVIGQYP